MYTHSVRIDDATQGMELAESVYIVTTSGANMLAARKGTKLDTNMIHLLKIRDVQMIDVFSDVPPDISSEGSLEPVSVAAEIVKPAPAVQDCPKPPPEKYVPVETVLDEKLKEQAVDSVKQLFACFDEKSDGTFNKTTAHQCVSNVEEVVGDLLTVITGDNTGLVHINDLKSFDEYTYHHSLSVSILSMATGRELGLANHDLLRLGRCAMLHDIGKQFIPKDIINKKGKLTDAEFDTIKTHSYLGANNLKINAIGDIELWNSIMFHHERIDGSGYPKQLKGKDIPLFSKIISVADVYDAITSYRTYRDPMLPSEAIKIIVKDAGSAFDYDVVKAFYAKLDIYPLNTIVELSDSRLGIVVDSENTFRLRPAVRIWGGNEVIFLSCATNRHINIVSVIDPATLPGGYEFSEIG